MAKPKNLIGKTYNELTVKKCVGKNKWHNYLWLCDCSCGGTHITTGGDLKSGRVKSCGCLAISNAIDQGINHKKFNTFIKDPYDPTITYMYDNKNNVCTIDTSEVGLLSQQFWTKYSKYWTNTKHELLHRFLMGSPKGKVVDHINRDKSDYRKAYLKVCTTKDNNRNMPVRKNKTDSDLPIGITRYRSKKLKNSTLEGRFMVSFHRNINGVRVSRSKVCDSIEEAITCRENLVAYYSEKEVGK
jgi:hypothetical protein